MKPSSLGQMLVLVACLVSSTITMSAQDGGETWGKVMYRGGVAGVRDTASVWDGTLTVSSHSIKLTREFINTPIFDLDPSSVTELAILDDKHNAGVAKTGSLLFGTLLKTTEHYAMISFALADGAKGTVLLRLDKSNADAIIAALHAVTKK